MTEDSGIADVAGARIAWWSQGEGSALVLVHAGVGDARMWDSLLPALPVGHRVVRYDMRGFGRTRAAAGTYADSRDLTGLLDALGIERAHLVGASYGGRVALELAATRPDRVASLVLLAPALDDIDPTPGLRAFADAEQQAIEDGRIEDAVAANVEMWTRDSSPEIRALVAEMQRIAFELQVREGSEEHELDPPVSARLGAIKAPTTIAIGDRDVADFSAVAERLLAGLPSASLRHISDAGHLLALDQPAAVAKLVADHLAGAEPSIPASRRR